MTMIIKLRQRNMHQYLFIHYHLQRIRPQRRWRRDRNQHQKWVVRDVCCGTNELRSIITPSHHQCLNKALFLFYSCSTWSCRFLLQDEGASSVYSSEHVRTKCVCTRKMFWRGRAAKCLRGEHLLNWFSSPGFFRYLQVGTSHCVNTNSGPSSRIFHQHNIRNRSDWWIFEWADKTGARKDEIQHTMWALMIMSVRRETDVPPSLCH